MTTRCEKDPKPGDLGIELDEAQRIWTKMVLMGGRLILIVQLAKATTLVALASTILVLILIVRWETKVAVAEGSWQPAQISAIVGLLGVGEGSTYLSASIEGADANRSRALIDLIGELPAEGALFLALALLVAFYLWLRRTGRAYTGAG